MNTLKKLVSNKRALGISVLLTTLLGIVLVVGVVHGDIPTRVGARGTVPNPGTQQQELPNITIPAPYNVFEFVVTCMACHGGTVDQNAGHGGNWAGSNMASAARDPIFRANQIIVNNALAASGENGAGNGCMRCHSPNAWYSGRFDPTLGGDGEGRTMMHSILLSTDDEGVQCEFCHRALGNVTYKRSGLNPNDPAWNMLSGISDWPHAGQPYSDQDGSPTIAAGNPLGDGTLQLHDGMTYNSRYPGIVDVFIDDIPLAPNGAGGYVRNPLGIYTGQTFGIYPPGWIDPSGNAVGGQPVVSPDGSLPLTFDAPIGPPLNPDGTPCYSCQSFSLEHPTTDNGFVTGPMTSNDSRLCGSCHDETMAMHNNGMPVQRTYTEWKFSALGRVGADFRNCQSCHMPRMQHEYTDESPVTLNVDPVLSGWFPYAKNRVNTAFHKLVGANRDLPMMMQELYPEVDLEVVGAPTGNDTRVFPGMNSDRATMWNRTQRNTEISLVDGVDVEIVGGPSWNGATGKWEMQVKVTNQSGHRIPSGYPDGRRFWINVQVTDQAGAVVYQSGSYSETTATLSTAPGVPFKRAQGTMISDTINAVMVYERVTGTCTPVTGPPTACTPSLNPLNDTILFDNRIPPKGFDYAAYRNAGVKFWNYDPVTRVPYEEATRYPNGQNWDLVTYSFTASPTALLKARVELYWQTQTREFVEYLKNQDTSTVRPEGPPSIYDPNYPLNPTYLSDVIGLAGIVDPYSPTVPLRDNWGGIAYAAWLLTGKGAPYLVGADDTTALAPPAAPVNVAGAPLDAFTIQVGWDAVSGADGYLVWVKYGLGLTTSSWDKLGIVYDDGNPATPLTILHEGLNVAKSYQYKVQAFNGAGFSADSAAIIVGTPVDLPLPPENLQFVSATGTTILMSWLDGADNETHFVIQRQPVPPLSPFVTVATIPSQTPGGLTGGNNWTDTGLTPGTCYNYQVAALNASGMSTWNVNGPVQMCTLGPPDAPSGLAAFAVSGSRVDLTWVAVPGAMGYRIERDLDAAFTLPLDGSFDVPNPAATGYSDMGVLPVTTYYYRVFAYNAGGTSLASNMATVTTLPMPPAAPTGLTASTPASFPPRQVTLTWNDVATNETNYVVERADGSGPGITFGVIATLGANSNSYVDMTVAPKLTYSYRVMAVNAGGPSGSSNVAVVVTPGEIPQAPSNLRVVQTTSKSLTLNWQDNANNELGFYIERSLNGTNGWVRVGTVGANVTAFTNTGLKAKTTYWYRVQAYNADGESAYTEIVAGTTKK